MESKNYVWCTYRNWSFKALEGLQDIDGWKTGLVVTTKDCVYDFSRLQARGIPILRVSDPKKDLREGGEAYEAILRSNPAVAFYNGWSWIVPRELFSKHPSLVLHPGKLPKDRGGSPIQNQMRRGETWTYANLIGLEKEVDAGPVYFKEKISLEGQADDVWARMTSVAIVTAKKYFKAYDEGNLNPIPQAGEPTFYKRVAPEQSELTKNMFAAHAERIVRAHNETDPNSYVTPAFIKMPGGKLVVERAALEPPKNIECIQWDPKISGISLDRLILDVNNGEKVISFSDVEGGNLYLTRVHKT